MGAAGRDFEALGAVLPRLAERRVTAVVGGRERSRRSGDRPRLGGSRSRPPHVLLECDLARPRLAAQLGLAPNPGLHEYLRWEASAPTFCSRWPSPARRPLQAGSCLRHRRAAGARPETLLGLQSFAHVVEKLRAGYDLVLLVAPPVLGEPVAALAAVSQADAVVAGLPADQANGRPGRGVRAAIRRLPAPALGAIAVGA